MFLINNTYIFKATENVNFLRNINETILLQGFVIIIVMLVMNEF